MQECYYNHIIKYIIIISYTHLYMELKHVIFIHKKTIVHIFVIKNSILHISNTSTCIKCCIIVCHMSEHNCDIDCEKKDRSGRSRFKTQFTYIIIHG